MAEITLKADTGRTTGTRPSRRLRAQGKIPAVVYGGGAEPTTVAVDWHDLRAALTTDAGLNALINIEIEGRRQLSIVKELQRHPVRQNVTHVDFLLIRRDVAIEVEVPVTLTGEAEKVTREDGMVDHVLFALTVKAKPADIPNELTVDISDMELGDTLRVSDLSLPAGVSTDVDDEEAVAIAQVTRSTIEAELIDLAEAEAEAEAAAEAEAEGDGGGGAAGGEGGGGSGDAGSPES